MTRGVFVIGTDTGVGKTIVAAGLTAALRARGLDAAYFKAVASDGLATDGRLVSPDAVLAAKAAGLSDPWRLLNPICLPGALSPLAAAEAAGLNVDLAEADQAFEELADANRFIIAEGVGGLLTPVTKDLLAADLLLRYRLPALIVARPGLGTINHTLLTIEALDRRGLDCLGFLYSGAQDADADPSRNTNAAHTALFTDKPFWGSLPTISNPESPNPKELLEAMTNLDPLLDKLVKSNKAV